MNNAQQQAYDERQRVRRSFSQAMRSLLSGEELANWEYGGIKRSSRVYTLDLTGNPPGEVVRFVISALLSLSDTLELWVSSESYSSQFFVLGLVPPDFYQPICFAYGLDDGRSPADSSKDWQAGDSRDVGEFILRTWRRETPETAK